MKFILLSFFMLLFSCNAQNEKFTQNDGKFNTEIKCDSNFILDNIIKDILLNPNIIGSPKRGINSSYSIFFPVKFVGLNENFNNIRNFNVKYYKENQLSSLDLKWGDILFRKIEFNKNFSELFVIVSYTGDDGDETLESNFYYVVDLDSCKSKLEKSDFIIVN